MKKITDPSKLLPAAKSVAVTRGKKAEIKPSSALVTRPKKDSAIIKAPEKSNAIVKSPQKSAALVRKENKGVEYVNVRMIAIENLFRNDFANVKKEAEEKRRKEEKQDFAEAEKKLETPKTKKLGLGGKGGDSPSIGFFDRVKRFLFFTALGWLLPKIIEFLPKLQGVVKTIGTIYKFAEGLFGKLFDGFMTLVKFGGDLKKSTLGFIAGMKEGDYQTEFTKLEKTFDTFVNASIIAGVLAADIGSAAVDELNKGRRQNRSGRGADYAAGFAAGLAAGKGIRPGAGFRDPGRYRIPGQARAGADFATNKARQAFTRKEMLRFAGPRGPLDRIGRGFKGAQAQLQTGTLFPKGAGAQRALYNLPGKAKNLLHGKQLLKVVKGPLSRLPILGGLIEFGLSWALGEPLGKAAFRGVGTVLLGAVGSLIAPGIGTFLLGWAGAELAGKLYEILFENKKPKGGIKTHSRGGKVINNYQRGGRVVNTYQGGGTARTTRRPLPKPPKVKKPIKTKPPETKVGRDVGGENKVVDFYAKSTEEKTPIFGNFAAALNYFSGSPQNKEQNRPLNALKGVSKILKDLPFGLGYFAGGAIDIALGQSMDVKKGLSQLSSGIAYMVDTLANQRANMSMTGLIRDLNAFAEGGTIPATRTLANPYSSVSSSDLIAKVIGPTIEQKVNEAMQSIEKDLRSLQQQKKDEPPSPGPGIDGQPGSTSISGTKFSDEINEASKISGMSAAQIAAMMEIESNFDPRADSGYARGLMQIAPATYRELYQKYGRRYSLTDDIYDTRTNAILGSLYMRDLYNGPANGNLETMVKMYNAGPAGNLSGSQPTNHWTKFQRALKGAQEKETQMQGQEQMRATGGTIPSSRFVTSPYGERIHPIYRDRRMHWGADYSGGDFSAGKPISIIKPGTVVYINTDRDGGGYGNYVVIKHDDGTYSKYSHLEKVNVRRGQKLSFSGGFAPVIGTVGSTGGSTGPHLHFEVGSGWNGRTLTGRRNPEPVAAQYFRGGGRVKIEEQAMIPEGRGGRGLINPTPRTRISENKGGYAADTGLDINGNIGDPILSPVDGILEYAEAGHTIQSNQDSNPNKPGFQPQYSFRIRLDKPFVFNGKTVNFVYGTHLSELDPNVANKSGIRISRGQMLGRMGQANNVPHLHIGFVTDREQRQFLNYREVRELLSGASFESPTVQEKLAKKGGREGVIVNGVWKPKSWSPEERKRYEQNNAQSTTPQGQGQITTTRQLGDAIRNLRPGQSVTVPGVGRVSRDKNGRVVYSVDGKGVVPGSKFLGAFDARNRRAQQPPKMQQGGIIRPRGTQLPIPNSYAPYETPAGSTMVLIQPYVIEKPSMTTGNRTIAFPVPISLNTSNKNLEALSRG